MPSRPENGSVWDKGWGRAKPSAKKAEKLEAKADKTTRWRITYNQGPGMGKRTVNFKGNENDLANYVSELKDVGARKPITAVRVGTRQVIHY